MTFVEYVISDDQCSLIDAVDTGDVTLVYKLCHHHLHADSKPVTISRHYCTQFLFL